MWSTLTTAHCMQHLRYKMCLLSPSLRRRVIGLVDIDCRSTLRRVLSKEEDHLTEYWIEIVNRGIDVSGLKLHPFQRGMAGHVWLPVIHTSGFVLPSMQSNVFQQSSHY